MADLQKVSQVFTQFGYESDPKQKVSAVSTQFAYEMTPVLKVSQVFVQFAYEQSTAGSPYEISISDRLSICADELDTFIQAVRAAAISDTLEPILDSINAALHGSFTVNISEMLPVITDSIDVVKLRAFVASISDTLQIVTDEIWAAMINMETPVRWVAPVSITPRVTTIDPLYLATHPVLHPEHYFEPRVKSYGTFTRAISAPAAFVKTGDVNISLVDSDNSIRQRIAAKTIRKALAEIRLGPEGGSYMAFLRPLLREVGMVQQPADGELTIQLRDFVFDKLEEPIPAIGTKDNFPNLPDGPSAFGAIIFGEVSSDVGAIPCQLVDNSSYDYLVARHPCRSVTIYKKGDGDEEFVPASGYSIIEQVVDGNTVTLARFGANPEADIRANASGMYKTETGDLIGTNFAYAMLQVLLMMDIEQSLDKINFNSFDAVAALTADLKCSGAVTSGITWGELLTRLQRSSNIDLFADKNDRITAKYTTDDEEPTVNLSDLLRLYKGSVSQQLADPAYNRIPYAYCPNYASGSWIEAVYDNKGDQERMGEIVEEERLMMYFVRDAATALAVVEHRSQYLDLDSFRFSGEIPLIPVLESLELADLVTIDHFGGIKSGGYAGEQFKILQLSMDIDHLKYQFNGIRRKLPPTEQIDEDFDYDDDLPGDTGSMLAINARPGPYHNDVEGELFSIWKNRTNRNEMNAWVTDDFGATWEKADDGNRPILDDEIDSYDCFAADGLMHIATQEHTTGRVAYHVFDMAARAWTTVDETVVAGCSNIDANCVSIERRNVGKEILIFFQGDRILYSGKMWQRGYYTMKSGGSWTSPIKVTPEPHETDEVGSLPWYWNPYHVSRDCLINRVVPGRENRMHFFYQYNDIMQFKPGEFVRTLQSDLSFTDRISIADVGWLYWPTARNAGGVNIGAMEDGRKIMVTRRRHWGAYTLQILSEASSLSLISSHYVDRSVSMPLQTKNPGAYAVEVDGRLHVIVAYGPEIVHYTSDDYGVTWTDGLRASPFYDDVWSWWPNRHLNGNVFKIRGREYISYFTSRTSSDTSWKYRWIRTDTLPFTA